MSVDPDQRRRLERTFDAFGRVEQAFLAALDESLRPRGPDLLYELVRALELPPGALALDVGCGEGKHACRLADRFGFLVTGIDPVPRQIEVATAALAALDPDLARRVRFTLGTAEELPVENGSADLVWCRDVLVHVADLERAYREFTRVLRDGGRVLVYHSVGTDRLERREAEWLWQTIGVVPGSLDSARTDAAIAAAALQVDKCIDLRSEWGEWAQERTGTAGRKLLQTARLLRDPERYETGFGRAAYEVMLGDCLWHVYAMIGKLERRVYVLAKP